MFKGIVAKIAKDVWDNAGKPAPQPAPAPKPAPQAEAVQDAEEANPASTVPDTDIEFPYYPGEGTACGESCRCRWVVDVRWSPEFGSNATFATWKTAADSGVCDDCRQRAEEWQDVMVRLEPND